MQDTKKQPGGEVSAPPAPAKRSGRLSSFYYEQRARIEQVFAEGKGQRANRCFLSTQITRLCRAAGLDRRRRDVTQQPGQCYIAAVRALRDKGEQCDTRAELVEISDCLTAYRERKAAAAPPVPAASAQVVTAAPQPAQPAQPAHPPKAPDDHRVLMGKDDEQLAHVGINGGDYLYGQIAARELQPGELGMVREIDGPGWRVGVVEAVTLDTITLRQAEDAHTFMRADLKHIARVTWYARRVQPMQPMPAPPANKINQLRTRLDQLDADSITDSTARFKLEQQIYDLEREAEQDEWAEVINA